jgi:serine phosphatase RsbU (regulator of sigma subunit)
METAARLYARRILLLHCVLLGLIVVGVVMSVRFLYRNSRDQAIDQQRSTLDLLGRQTAAGVGNYYQAVFNVLELLEPLQNDLRSRRPALQPSDGAAAASPDALPTAGPVALDMRDRLIKRVFKSIAGRVSRVMVVDRTSMAVLDSFGEETPNATPAEVVAAAKPFLELVDAPSISEFVKFGDRGGHVAAVPLATQNRLLVAIVPVDRVERQLLGDFNRRDAAQALLIDDRGVIMSAVDSRVVGLRIDRDIPDPRLREAAGRFLTAQGGSEVFDRYVHLSDDVVLEPVMISVQPVKLPGGRVWWVVVSMDLGEVDKVVNPIFREAMTWAIFVMIATSAILVSTAVHMIRSRSTLERLRNELLEKELAQARAIQLSWLPQQDLAHPAIQCAALNEPASHISGDFYDYFELPDGSGRSVVTIGDVTGHGMAAAFMMATTQLLVRTTLQRVDGDPGRGLTEVNRQLATQAFNGQFVTLLICVLDPREGRLHMASAGHHPPLVCRNSHFEQLPLDPQLVAAVDEETEYRTQTYSLRGVRWLLLYTDGVIEAQSESGDRFSADALAAALQPNAADATELATQVKEIVDDFRGAKDLEDDLTCVAIGLQPEADPDVTATPELAAVP